MRTLFNELKTKINAEVTAIKTVRMFNNQIDRAKEEKKEKAFAHPACFIEFITTNIVNRAMGLKDVDLIVRFRFALEGYKFERLDDLDFLDTFDNVMQSFHGDENDPVTFTTFGQAVAELDEDFDNVNAPHLDYQTHWRNIAAFKRTSDSIKQGVVTSIITAILPTFDETFDETFG